MNTDYTDFTYNSLEQIPGISRLQMARQSRSGEVLYTQKPIIPEGIQQRYLNTGRGRFDG